MCIRDSHYSDGHLLMQGDIMELWFRHNGGQDPARNADNNGARILRMVSADGIHWSEPKEMIPKQGRKPLISPDVYKRQASATSPAQEEEYAPAA